MFRGDSPNFAKCSIGWSVERSLSMINIEHLKFVDFLYKYPSSLFRSPMEYTVSGKKWNHFIFASNFASAGQFSKFFHQQT